MSQAALFAQTKIARLFLCTVLSGVLLSYILGHSFLQNVASIPQSLNWTTADAVKLSVLQPYYHLSAIRISEKNLPEIIPPSTSNYAVTIVDKESEQPKARKSDIVKNKAAASLRQKPLRRNKQARHKTAITDQKKEKQKQRLTTVNAVKELPAQGTVTVQNIFADASPEWQNQPRLRTARTQSDIAHEDTATIIADTRIYRINFDTDKSDQVEIRSAVAERKRDSQQRRTVRVARHNEAEPSPAKPAAAYRKSQKKEKTVPTKLTSTQLPQVIKQKPKAQAKQPDLVSQNRDQLREPKIFKAVTKPSRLVLAQAEVQTKRLKPKKLKPNKPQHSLKPDDNPIPRQAQKQTPTEVVEKAPENLKKETVESLLAGIQELERLKGGLEPEEVDSQEDNQDRISFIARSTWRAKSDDVETPEPSPPNPDSKNDPPIYRGSQSPQPTPPANPLPQLSSTPKSSSLKITGLLTNVPRDLEGHFEIGFYSGISSAGNPIGAPILQEILHRDDRKFSLSLPRGLKGYVFAQFIPHGSKASPIAEWSAYPHQVKIGPATEAIRIIVPVGRTRGRQIATIANNKNGIELRGRIEAMFAREKESLPLAGAMIRVRGSDKLQAKSDKNGNFVMSIPKASGRVLLEVLKEGYHPTVKEIDLKPKDGKIFVEPVELASQVAIQNIAHALGIHQSADLSVAVVEVSTSDKSGGLPGVALQSSLEAEGPYYFNTKGFPERNLRSTTFDGRAIFFNVKPGVGFLEAFILGADVVPYVMTAVKGNAMIHERISFMKDETSIVGRIFDPISSVSGKPVAVVGARVRLGGSAEWTETDGTGRFELAGLRLIENSEVFIEVSASDFYNHRFALRLDKRNWLNGDRKRPEEFYLFPMRYINKLANSVDLKLNPNHGLLMGSLGSGNKVRVDVLADHSEENRAKDFYFNRQKVIQGSHAFTDPDFGTFSVFDVPAGRGLIQGYDRSGGLRYSGLGYFSPSTITVKVSDARH